MFVANSLQGHYLGYTWPLHTGNKISFCSGIACRNSFFIFVLVTNQSTKRKILCYAEPHCDCYRFFKKILLSGKQSTISSLIISHRAKGFKKLFQSLYNAYVSFFECESNSFKNTNELFVATIHLWVIHCNFAAIIPFLKCLSKAVWTVIYPKGHIYLSEGPNETMCVPICLIFWLLTDLSILDEGSRNYFLWVWFTLVFLDYI